MSFGQFPRDEIYEQIEYTKERLEKARIVLVGCKQSRRRENHSSDYYSNMVHDTAGNVHKYQTTRQIETESEWQICMTHSQIIDLLDLQEELAHTRTTKNRISEERDTLNRNFTSLRSKTLAFEEAIRKVPGLREQWDEMRTIMILHGFDKPMDFT
jgi:GTPase SAR1 family protein